MHFGLAVNYLLKHNYNYCERQKAKALGGESERKKTTPSGDNSYKG